MLSVAKFNLVPPKSALELGGFFDVKIFLLAIKLTIC